MARVLFRQARPEVYPPTTKKSIRYSQWRICVSQYKLWKQKLISDAVFAHQQTLPAVNGLSDPGLLALYDRVLGVLMGPHTIRLRQNPGILEALRLRKAQRSFASAVRHHEKSLHWAKNISKKA